MNVRKNVYISTEDRCQLTLREVRAFVVACDQAGMSEHSEVRVQFNALEAEHLTDSLVEHVGAVLERMLSA